VILNKILSEAFIARSFVFTGWNPEGKVINGMEDHSISVKYPF